MAPTSRFLLGVTNGLLGISKTVISEVCGKEHEMVGMASILGEHRFGNGGWFRPTNAPVQKKFSSKRNLMSL